MLSVLDCIARREESSARILSIISSAEKFFTFSLSMINSFF